MTDLEMILVILLGINAIALLILFIDNKKMELELDDLKLDYKCFISTTLSELRYARYSKEVLNKLYDKVFNKYWSIK